MKPQQKPSPKARVKLSLEQQACNLRGELADCAVPPQTLDLLPLLKLVPRKLWIKAPKPHGCLVVGLSPRSLDKTTIVTNELLEFTKLLCFFVKRNLPDFNFTSIGVRVGGKLNAHKDMSTTGMSAVLSGSGIRPCLFWYSSLDGACFEEFDGGFIPGVVTDLSG